jgi:hypothetical protein
VSEVWALPLLSTHLARHKHLRIAMHSPDFKLFLEHLYPTLRRANLSFAIVTAMEDYSLPWEEFVCRPATGSEHKQSSPGVRLRRFLRDPLLVHCGSAGLSNQRQRTPVM